MSVEGIIAECLPKDLVEGIAKGLAEGLLKDFSKRILFQIVVLLTMFDFFKVVRITSMVIGYDVCDEDQKEWKDNKPY